MDIQVSEIPLRHGRLAEIDVTFAYGEGRVADRENARRRIDPGSRGSRTVDAAREAGARQEIDSGTSRVAWQRRKPRSSRFELHTPRGAVAGSRGSAARADGLAPAARRSRLLGSGPRPLEPPSRAAGMEATEQIPGR